jgi:hypothetical protein
MPNEVTADQRRYDALVEKIALQYRTAEAGNLRRYHTIGELVSEFVAGLDSKRYGDATIEKLAADLQERGSLGDVRDPGRFLYWAKNLSDAYPDFKQLEALSQVGFTVSHAKRIFTLAKEVREEVEQGMIKDGLVISTRDLDTLIGAVNQRRIAAASAAAAAEFKDTKDAAPAAPGPRVAVAAGADEDLLEDGVAGSPPQEPADAPADPAADPKAGTVGAVAQRERTVGSPLKVISTVEKALTKANAGLPDAFIVVREAAQIGFDSDVALAKYNEHLSNLKAAAKSLKEPLEELLKAIEGELDATAAVAPQAARRTRKR